MSDGSICGTGRTLCMPLLFFCKFNELIFETKLFSKLEFLAKMGGLAAVAGVVVVLLEVVMNVCIFGALERAAGIGAASKSMMIKCSVTSFRVFRGGFVMRGGTGGTSGGISKLHVLFECVDESFASK